MEPTLLIFAIASAVAFFISVLRTNILVDRMLKKLYSSHRELWESLGEPKGWTWAPPGGVPHPFQRLWPGMASREKEPAWLDCAPDIRLDFRQWQKEARRANYVFFPLMVLIGSLA